MGAQLEQAVLNGPLSLLERDKTTGEFALSRLYGAIASNVDAGIVLPVEQLFVIFGVLSDEGLGCAVLDYVREVCLDDSRVSADPIEARLLDSRLVLEWGSWVLKGAGTLRGSGPGRSADRVHRARLRLEVAAQAAEAIERTDPPGVAALLSSLRRHLAFVVALESYPASRAQQAEVPPGRNRTHQEWAGAVAARRARAQEAGIRMGLDELLDRAGSGESSAGVSGGAAIAYPPRDPVAFLGSVLVDGVQAGPAAAVARRLLVLYSVADSEGSIDTYRELARDLGASAAEATEARCRALLDSALGGPTTQSLVHEGASLALGAGDATLSLWAASVLSTVGRPSEALALLRAASAAPPTPTPAHLDRAADLSVRCCLSLGLLREAFHHIQAVSDSDKAAALVEEVSAWALRQGGEAARLLVALPWSPSEEAALERWLVQAAEAGTFKTAGEVLTVFRLTRGDLLGAAGVAASSGGEAGDGMEVGGATGAPLPPPEGSATHVALVEAVRTLAGPGARFGAMRGCHLSWGSGDDIPSVAALTLAGQGGAGTPDAAPAAPVPAEAGMGEDASEWPATLLFGAKKAQLKRPAQSKAPPPHPPVSRAKLF